MMVKKTNTLEDQIEHRAVMKQVLWNTITIERVNLYTHNSDSHVIDDSIINSCTST